MLDAQQAVSREVWDGGLMRFTESQPREPPQAVSGLKLSKSKVGRRSGQGEEGWEHGGRAIDFLCAME